MYLNCRHSVYKLLFIITIERSDGRTPNGLYTQMFVDVLLKSLIGGQWPIARVRVHHLGSRRSSLINIEHSELLSTLGVLAKL